MSFTLAMSFALIALTGSGSAQASPQGATRVAKPPGAILLELFTSEGCSSCPPADELLRQMNGVKTPQGDLIVAISEHVTYWNQLGWKDRFSSEAFTDRQKAYLQRFRLDEVYTPQMVINGESAIVGSNRPALLRGLMNAHPAKPGGLHIVSAGEQEGKLTLTYSYTPRAGALPADLYAVVAEDQASSDVLRGENKGRTLHHVAVATAFAKLDAPPAGVTRTAEIPLAKEGAATAVATPIKRHLIVFAQATGLGPVQGVETVPF